MSQEKSKRISLTPDRPVSMRKNHMQTHRGFSILLALLTLAVSFAFAERQPSASASMVASGRDLGAEDPSTQMTATVWLRQRNKPAFDALVKSMYEKGSPNYHKWLTMADYKAKFAPADQDAAAVRDFLTSHNLTIVSTDKNNHYVMARGRVGDVQNAFSVQIRRFDVKGAVRRVATTEPSVAGPTGTVVAAVQVGDLAYSSDWAPSRDLDTGKAYAGVPLTPGVNPDGLFFSANCFRKPETKIFKTPGGGPYAVYSGNRYGSNISSGPPNLSPCGYDAAELETAYGLKKAFKKGWDGTGQTIVIVDAFGSNTILADANAFADLNGLPELTSSNFQTFTPNGSATCTATNGCIAGNWQFETTLDVESAHAIAPGANIALVLGADNSFTNLDIANLFAIENLLGNVLSNSFGISEIALVDFFPSELVVENGLSELAAALGISQQISTGDAGDNLIVDQNDFGINAVSPQANATSPFVTAVGGTSLFLNGDKSIKFQTGWGMNFARIANPTPNPPTIPPLLFGFQGGAGGGVSTFFAKPSFQSSLPGSFRMVPDISMEADPETGIEIIVTPDSVPGDQQFVEVFGGTSLSAPMFSALWAVTNQVAGVPLGQAAPILYSLTGGAITDVTDLTSPFNVAGVIFNPPNPPTLESPDALAAPLDGTTNYISALFQSPSSTRWDVFTFGTDSSLTTGPGWDNVTGLGTPNAVPLIQQVVALTAK
ncbi:MAG TPA: S53 family peptidase [Terriglobales bacterium]|nr:S53 family peptidase [Terriglobales bacterium]